ncbi:MAG: TrmH family RNA methyltransferase [Burkholderiales bacterium]
MKTIRSRDNPLLKQLVKLSASSRERRHSGTTILDGEHLIEAYCGAGLPALESIVASESGMQRSAVVALMEKAEAKTKAIIEDKLLAQISQVVTSSGILAVISTPLPPPMPENIDAGLYLEEIQDPGNLGSIFRTALAAGVRDVYLSSKCVFAWSPKVVRAGMGAHFHLAIHENVTLDRLQAGARGRLLATQAGGGITLHEIDLREPTIWMFGNEGAGLSCGAVAIATKKVTIPMVGLTESLNVAAAVAVCLFEQLRQRH